MVNNVGKVEREEERFLVKLRAVKPIVKQVWYRGQWPSSAKATAGEHCIFEKCCAVVGSRKMSRYGKQVLAEVIPKLCNAGYTIVSGLMYGVDQEAHKLTLECGGRAVAVLAYGLKARSEEGATKLADKIVESGGVVISEYPKDMTPKRWMFLQRNRIVVGLSEMVIVAEAGEKSGSLHTATLAKKQGKDLYAIPGGIFSPTSVGTNNLIASGVAKAMTTRELDHLTNSPFNHLRGGEVTRLNDGEREIAVLLKIEGPMGANEIARSLGENVGEILGRLMKMEMGGVLTEERGIWKLL